VYLNVYTNSGRTTHQSGSPVNVTGFGTNTWQYFMPVCSYNEGSGTGNITAYYRNISGSSIDIGSTSYMLTRTKSSSSDAERVDDWNDWNDTFNIFEVRNIANNNIDLSDGTHSDTFTDTDHIPTVSLKPRIISPTGSTVDVDWYFVRKIVDPEPAIGVPYDMAPLQPNGISSLETFGAASISVSIIPASIVPAETFGDLILNIKLAPSAIASLEAFGSGNLATNQFIQAFGIATGEGFGNATLYTGTWVLPASIAGAEVFGTGRLTLFISPTAIATSAAFGTATVSYLTFLQLAGISSTETHGTCLIVAMAPFSRGNYAALPSDDADLENSYTPTERGYVESDDNIYAEQSATGEYIVHQFKDNVGANTLATFSLSAKSSQAPLISPVSLQIYNRNISAWETIAVNNIADADEKFTLYAYVGDLTNYKDGNNVISNRVCQLAL
jgi:hypothetical protein